MSLAWPFRLPLLPRLFAAVALWATIVATAHPLVHVSAGCERSAEVACGAGGCATSAALHGADAHDAGADELCVLCTFGGDRWTPSQNSGEPATVGPVVESFAWRAGAASVVRAPEHEHCLTRRGPPAFLPA